MREQNHIVGTLGTGLVDGLLDELVEGFGLQIVEQHAVGIVERIALEDHCLGGAGSDVGHLLMTIFTNDIGGKHGVVLPGLVEIGTDHGDTRLLQQLQHAGYAIVELVVA